MVKLIMGLSGSGKTKTLVELVSEAVNTASGDVVTAYLCAYNFVEYEPYIDLNGHAAPGADAERNQVSLVNQSAQNANFAMLKPEKSDEEKEAEDTPEEDTVSGDGPDPSQGTEAGQ